MKCGWVFAAIRDNLYSLSQIVALFGQAGKNIEAASYGESLLRPASRGTYAIFDESPEFMKLQGVAIYHDNEKARFRHAKIVHGKDESFDRRYKADLRNAAKHPPPSEFARLYPRERPARAEEGGWDGTLEESVTMYIGVGIDAGGDNKVLTDRGEGGAFVWSERTMKKLAEANVNGSIEERQVKLICCMFQQMYSLMMATQEVIQDGSVP